MTDDRLPPMTMKEMIELAGLDTRLYSDTIEKNILSFYLHNGADLARVCVEIGIVASERDEDKGTVRDAFAEMFTVENGDDDSLYVCFPTVPWQD